MVLGLLQQRLYIATRHEGQDHVGLAVVLPEVVDGQDVGMVAQAAHGLGLSRDADAGGRVQALCLDDGKGDVAVENGVVGLVDTLLATLANEVLDLVAAVGEGRGCSGRCRW